MIENYYKFYFAIAVPCSETEYLWNFEIYLHERKFILIFAKMQAFPNASSFWLERQYAYEERQS